MRNNVIFRHPAEFIRVSEDEGILSITGVQWFVSLLQRVNALSIESELCQEDWGVVVFAERGGKRFWIGVSLWPEDEQMWLAHFHHGSFAWLQPWSVSGKRALDQLVSDFHAVLTSEPGVRDIAWSYESDMRRAHPPRSVTPDAA